jgi:UDP-N-acetylglucosamine 4,6-dehydratase
MKDIFKNKKILVTGGTGSFGQEFVKTLCKNFNFKKLAIFSRDELKQFEMEEKLKDNRLRFLLGDLRDYDRVKFALSDIDFVVHAAALKQVPKAEYNPSEYIKTNIIGSENIIRASIETNVNKVLSLSTDKAASPINLYGATKLVADKLFTAANNMVGSKNIIFSTVRYGNVLNSRGSVIPFFKQQISQNKPLSITHNDATRFFLSLSQGVNFVINSFKFMKGGEIFVPKIPSFNIKELAECMSNKSKKKIIGLRPGEKIHEVLISKDETNVYEYKNFYVIAPSIIMDKSKNYKSYFMEKGRQLKIDFEYSSNLNSKFLNKTNLKKYIKKFI